jgi:hypothetical protein
MRTRVLTACALFFLCSAVVQAAGNARTAPHRPAQISLHAVEGQDQDVSSFNPKEISVDKSVPWQKHKGDTSDAPSLEFTSGDGRSISIELQFDAFESKGDVRQPISQLEQLTLIRDDLRRPPLVELEWGSLRVRGVIESVIAKYTRFLPDGTPVQASVTLRLRETDRADIAPERP